jgi:hypothetical protein
MLLMLAVVVVVGAVVMAVKADRCDAAQNWN